MGAKRRHFTSAKIARQLGEAIRANRKALGIPQDELAWRVETHRAYMGAIERGEQNITVFTLYKISHALGTKPSDLLKQIGI